MIRMARNMLVVVDNVVGAATVDMVEKAVMGRLNENVLLKEVVAQRKAAAAEENEYVKHTNK